MSLLIAVMFSCVQEYYDENRDADEKGRKTNSTGLTVQEGKSFFESYLMRGEYATRGSVENLRIAGLNPGSMSPIWQKSIKSEDRHIYSLDIVIDKKYQYIEAFSEQSESGAVTRYEEIEQKLVIVKNKKTGNMSNYIMSMLPDRSYPKQRRGQRYHRFVNTGEHIYCGLVVYTRLEDGVVVRVDEYSMGRKKQWASHFNTNNKFEFNRIKIREMLDGRTVYRKFAIRTRGIESGTGGNSGTGYDSGIGTDDNPISIDDVTVIGENPDNPPGGPPTGGFWGEWGEDPNPGCGSNPDDDNGYVVRLTASPTICVVGQTRSLSLNLSPSTATVRQAYWRVERNTNVKHLGAFPDLTFNDMARSPGVYTYKVEVYIENISEPVVVQTTVENIFPDIASIADLPSVRNRIAVAWQATKDFVALPENRKKWKKEFGFSVQINTQGNTPQYFFRDTVGLPASYANTASITLSLVDNYSSGVNSGGTYTVADFHTHPPYTYAPYGDRGEVGPSYADLQGGSTMPGMIKSHKGTLVRGVYVLRRGDPINGPDTLIFYGINRRTSF